MNQLTAPVDNKALEFVLGQIRQARPGSKATRELEAVFADMLYLLCRRIAMADRFRGLVTLDAMQDAVLIAFKARGKFRPGAPGKFERRKRVRAIWYFTTILINAMRHWMRRQKSFDRVRAAAIDRAKAFKREGRLHGWAVLDPPGTLEADETRRALRRQMEDAGTRRLMRAVRKYPDVFYSGNRLSRRALCRRLGCSRAWLDAKIERIKQALAGLNIDSPTPWKKPCPASPRNKRPSC